MIATRVIWSSAPAVRSALQSSTLSHIAAAPRQALFKPVNSGQWRGMASRRARMAMQDSTAEQAGARRSIKERLMGPATETPFTVGQLGVAAASGVGIGALCFYGLGFGKEAGAIDRMGVWPEHVKARVRDTYMYFSGGLGLTAASAAACFRSPTIMNLVTKNGLLAIAGTIALLIGSGAVVRSIEYRPGFGAKQLAWMAHAGIVGAVIAPLSFLGGPLLIRAATYTAGVVGGLSAVAMCAPSDQFLYMGGALGMGLGAVFMASIGSAFLPPTTALGAGLYSLSVYGGLVLFGGFLLYDTQRIVKSAENHPYYGVQAYDPVNHSISIYMDTINIFIRIAMILAGNRKK